MHDQSMKDARILIVDDQDGNTRLLERILAAAGYVHYKSLNDPRQVVAAFREWDPDLILLDLAMPGLDGYAVMEQLAPLVPPDSFSPILVITADVSQATRKRALLGGAKDFLTKPIDSMEVVLRIANLLETRFLHLRLREQNRVLEERVRERTLEVQDQATLLAKARDAILVRDLGDRIVFWNDGAERLYGWTRAEAVGRNANELLRLEASQAEEATRVVLAKGEWVGELRQRTKGDAEVTVQSRWTLVRDEKGRPKTKLVINTDVTEKKGLEAQLLHAQRMEGIGMLAGGVAHDFNNLLTVITGCSELVLLKLRPEDPLAEFVREIRKAGDRATSLTRQLLAFSRKQILAPVVLDLNALLTEIGKMLGRLIGEDLTLTTSLDPTLGRVRVDPGQLEHVLVNLAFNAREAMPTGGRLAMETRNVELDESFRIPGHEVNPGPYVLLTFKDTGCGMDAETRAHVFEPFFTTKEVGKGPGLGLSSVYGIVRQSDGYIDLDSEAGRGTTFRIYLPRVTEAAPNGKPAAAPSTGSKGKETVLVAEDEASVRTISRLTLLSAGYCVLEARDGDDAQRVAEGHQGPIHLLVTDVVMPKTSGRQLVELLRPLHPDMKVLFVSGYADDVVVRNGVLDTGLAFLQKPFTPSSLLKKVREVLG